MKPYAAGHAILHVPKWTVGQIKFPMTRSDKWTRDRAKLIDRWFRRARDVSGRVERCQDCAHTLIAYKSRAGRLCGDHRAGARVVLAKRERVIMLKPWDKGLRGTTLRYPYEMRDAKEYFDDIPNLKVAPDMLKLAEHYEDAVVKMLKKKQAGLPVSREHATPRPQNVINLMDALRRFIAQEKATSAPPKKGRKRIEGQGEMLLPIPGKTSKEAGAKPAERPGAR
jgi:hypothetical protein